MLSSQPDKTENQNKIIFPKIPDKRISKLMTSTKEARKLKNLVNGFLDKNPQFLSAFESHFAHSPDKQKEFIPGLCFGLAITAILLKKNRFAAKKISKQRMLGTLSFSFLKDQEASEIKSLLISKVPNLFGAIDRMGKITKCNVENMSLGAAIFLKAYEKVQVLKS